MVNEIPVATPHDNDFGDLGSTSALCSSKVFHNPSVQITSRGGPEEFDTVNAIALTNIDISLCQLLRCVSQVG